jgi:hypothetical protein
MCKSLAQLALWLLTETLNRGVTPSELEEVFSDYHDLLPRSLDRKPQSSHLPQLEEVGKMARFWPPQARVRDRDED